jgi:hypothetical protein
MGDLYFDADGSAHARYGAILIFEAVVVVRAGVIIGAGSDE